MAVCDFSLHNPRTLAEACTLGRDLGENGRYLAGGTELLLDLKNKRENASQVINLQAIPELRHITLTDGSLRIGAMATLTEVVESAEVQRAFPELAAAVLTMAGPQIRNQGTIGGNFCRAVPCADTPPVCLAARATLQIVGVAGAREVTAEQFFLGPRQTVLSRDELLVSLTIPPLPSHCGTSYQRFSLRGGSALAVAAVAAQVVLDGERLATARVVLSAVAPVPLLAEKCNDILRGQTVSSALFRQAAKQVAAEAQPITDIRGSDTFRRELVAVLTVRALETASARARGEDI
ncbi:MAG: xanthine dehydrogenase family protein subunit M [bacterium]